MRAHQRKALRPAPEAPPGPLAPVFFGPGRWVAGEGAWADALPFLRALPQPLGLVAEAGLLRSLRGGLTRAWLEAGLDLRLIALPDASDCSRETLDRVADRAREQGLGGLIGLGGGRMLDLAKLAGKEIGLPVATAPSSAATCACATSVAVLNGPQGGFADVVDLESAPALCVVETPVLRRAPARLLAAGMADTLAKWMEWSAVEGSPEGFGAGAAWALAKAAFDVCAGAGAEALADPDSAAFDAVLEACLLWSAAASCVGRAPAAAAHSLANALSRQRAGAALLHGEAVGLGLLWQESLLQGRGRATMGADALAALLASWGLPTVLPGGLDLGLLSRDATAPGESVHLLGLRLDAASAQATLLGGP